MSSTNGSGGGGGGESGYTYVYYFIPQDGDSEDHPNAFLIRKPGSAIRQSTIAEVHSATPKHTCTCRQPRRQTWHHALFSPRAWTRAHTCVYSTFHCQASTFSALNRLMPKAMVSHTQASGVSPAALTRVLLVCLFVCFVVSQCGWTAPSTPQSLSHSSCPGLYAR